jgi:hypothetical protein
LHESVSKVSARTITKLAYLGMHSLGWMRQRLLTDSASHTMIHSTIHQHNEPYRIYIEAGAATLVSAKIFLLKIGKVQDF